MAADLHIHVFEEGQLTEDHFRAVFSNTIGSKWELPWGDDRAICGSPFQEWAEPLRLEVYETSAVWVGEVSWLKAALLGNAEAYIPDTVAEVYEIIGEEQPTVTEELIEKVKEAFRLPNKTAQENGGYCGEGYSLANVNDVVKFLEKHIGWKAFTVSW